MLNKIPKNLSPEIVKTLMQMGHGDEILLSDGNYPAMTNNDKVLRADGLGVPEILKSVLELMPLDTYSDYQAILMQVVPGDKNVPGGVPPIWKDYEEKINNAFPGANIKQMERQAFYKYSRNCFAIIETGETALYGNLILRKGVVE